MKPKASFIRTDLTLSERKLEKCLLFLSLKREKKNPCSLHVYESVKKTTYNEPVLPSSMRVCVCVFYCASLPLADANHLSATLSN